MSQLSVLLLVIIILFIYYVVVNRFLTIFKNAQNDISRIADKLDSLDTTLKILSSRLSSKFEEIDEESEEELEPDPLLETAEKMIKNTDKVSASYLQRSLKIGYARACKILDQLEEKGVVGPTRGSKPRKVLITK